VVVRRLTLLVVLALGLAACGGSGTSNVKITFGGTVGAMAPERWAVTISPRGAVATTGEIGGTWPKALTSAQEADLSRLVQNDLPNIKSRRCRSFPGARKFVKARGRTVWMRGDCDARFWTFWDKLIKASGFQPPPSPPAVVP
jgi:hypothetical protein